jgi:hypothetical protein
MSTGNATPPKRRTPDARDLPDREGHRPQDLHPVILDAISAMRTHAEELNAMAGEYYGAFPPTAEEREELIQAFAASLREAAQP